MEKMRYIGNTPSMEYGETVTHVSHLI
jgi:hypothetical protein